MFNKQSRGYIQKTLGLMSWWWLLTVFYLSFHLERVTLWNMLYSNILNNIVLTMTIILRFNNDNSESYYMEYLGKGFPSCLFAILKVMPTSLTNRGFWLARIKTKKPIAKKKTKPEKSGSMKSFLNSKSNQRSFKNWIPISSMIKIAFPLIDTGLKKAGTNDFLNKD